MEDFVTIKIANNSAELLIIKAMLESVGIKCFIKDEMTIGAVPYYSNALGGVKLQVKISDKERAITVLKESGNIETNEFQLSDLSKMSRGNFKRNFILLSFGLIVIVSSLGYLSLPSKRELLSKYSWCVDYIKYNGKVYNPTTQVMKLIGPGFCEEEIKFREKGQITLPGFKSGFVYGNWFLQNDQITISNIDTFNFLYSGVYKLSIHGGKLTMISSNTEIHCTQARAVVY